MLAIRLQRTGRKHEPTFRVVLTDSKNGPKSGKFIEILGSYDARQKERATINKERIQHWISNGAQVSGTVHNVLVDQGVIKGDKINVLPKKTAPVKEEAPIEEVAAETPATEEVTEAPVTETPVAETPAEEAPVEAETPAEEPAKEETPATEEVAEEKKEA